jgi:tetratricopeptide (TPR) repeat protein
VKLARRRLSWRMRTALLAAGVLVSLAQRLDAEEPARAAARSNDAFRSALELGLDHYRDRRFAEAREAFEQALGMVPAGDSRDNLEFDIAACDYELGHFRAAEERFARLGERPSANRGAASEALLHAGWAALGADDVPAAERYLARTPQDPGLGEQRTALAEGIEKRRQELDQRAFDRALGEATAAYDAGDLSGAEAAVGAARTHAGTPSSRAAVDYLAGLLAHERGDDDAARAALMRSLRANPNDGSVLALLGTLEQAGGDAAAAERHYRASLDADLPPEEASAIREALDGLYPVPRTGFAVWAALGAGYDSNATQSGSSDAVGYAAPGDQGSPFAAPTWGIEYRLDGGRRTRIVPYYTGSWLVLSNTTVQDASLQSHEAGARWHWAPSPAVELRLGAGGGATLSGLELSPFSLDGLLWGRAAMVHGPSFRSALLVEARPSLGLSGRDYLTGTRTDLSLSERFESGAWGATVNVGLRYNAIGTERIGIDPARFPRCNQGCTGAGYLIPLGYVGPIAGAGVDVAVIPELELAVTGKYEHRTYLDQSRINGPILPALVRELSEKTRVDDRYTLGARARYRIASAPEIGVFLDYALRISRSNVASNRADLEHAFDYDDRNFTQHILELGLDVRH